MKRFTGALTLAISLSFPSGCASAPPFEAEGNVPFMGSGSVSIGRQGSPAAPKVVTPPGSVQALFDCMARERDPLLPFDSCECYRQYRVQIPEATQCFGDDGLPTVPREFLEGWADIGSPELKVCEPVTDKDGQLWLTCEVE